MSDKLIKKVREYGDIMYDLDVYHDTRPIGNKNKLNDIANLILENIGKEEMKNRNRNPVAKKLEGICSVIATKFEKSEYNLISDLILFFDGEISLDTVCIKNNFEMYDIPYSKRRPISVIIPHVKDLYNKLLSNDSSESLQPARILKKISEYFEGTRNFNSILT
jgi:hypothetical protein